MRVLTIIDSLAVGGAERSLAMITPHLVDRGIEMHIGYLRERPGIHRELIRGGAELHPLDGAEAWIPSIRRTAALIRSLEPNLVHTTLFKADVIGRTAARLAGVPVISSFVTESYGPEHVRNPEYRAWKVRGAQLVDALTARFVTHFHAVSTASAEAMARRLRVDLSQIDVISRGRDPRRLGERSEERRRDARGALGIGENDLLVAAAARHYHLKGLDVLAEAFGNVSATYPQARLLLAGRFGPATPDIERILADTAPEGTATMLGYRSDVPELICAADVFVVPSRAEGSPGSLLEAMALQAPIVATDIPSVREVAGDEPATLLLCAVDSPDDMAEKILAIPDDPGSASTRVAAAYRRFHERYAIDAIADATAALYARHAQR